MQFVVCELCLGDLEVTLREAQRKGIHRERERERRTQSQADRESLHQAMETALNTHETDKLKQIHLSNRQPAKNKQERLK